MCLSDHSTGAINSFTALSCSQNEPLSGSMWRLQVAQGLFHLSQIYHIFLSSTISGLNVSSCDWFWHGIAHCILTNKLVSKFAKSIAIKTFVKWTLSNPRTHHHTNIKVNVHFFLKYLSAKAISSPRNLVTTRTICHGHHKNGVLCEKICIDPPNPFGNISTGNFTAVRVSGQFTFLDQHPFLLVETLKVYSYRAVVILLLFYASCGAVQWLLQRKLSCIV